MIKNLKCFWLKYLFQHFLQNLVHKKYLNEIKILDTESLKVNKIMLRNVIKGKYLSVKCQIITEMGKMADVFTLNYSHYSHQIIREKLFASKLFAPREYANNAPPY